jgi:glyoxylase-like metal-dependent hydrolase (beta-lactamase superfamily II)
MVEIIQIEAGPFDSNIFLIKDRGNAVLIDTGSGFYNNAVEDSIKRSLGGDDLKGVILTHEHFDHSGGAKYLKEAFSVPLFGSPECARAMREADPNLTGRFLFGAHMDPVMEIDEIGPELEIGTLSFDVHSTPGHAPGLVCLIERTEKHLFCGDLVFCDGGVGRWDLPGGDLSLLKGSIDRSMEWEVSSLYPGHGRYETRDPKGQMEMARRMLSMV